MNSYKHPFLNLLASCLETGRAEIPKINPNLYSVSKICVLIYVKEPNTKESNCLTKLHTKDDPKTRPILKLNK